MSSATKEKMLDAAMTLFHVQGYDGTTIRHIAEKAKVNVALVSYYFGGKKGLFEELMVRFLEGYLQKVEAQKSITYENERERLAQLIKELLIYQQVNHHLARVVHRELTLDSTLVRELMSTYLRKEKHEIEIILKKGMKTGEFVKQPLDLLTIHIRNLIIMPYLYPHYLQELCQLSTTEQYFMRRYIEQVNDWINKCLCKEEGQGLKKNKIMVPLVSTEGK
ncbi:putative transcriptional regulator [Bacillus sp. TS-2]|nr:putative transcriptional regulator [Bacillus sp. TS-2]